MRTRYGANTGCVQPTSGYVQPFVKLIKLPRSARGCTANATFEVTAKEDELVSLQTCVTESVAGTVVTYSAGKSLQVGRCRR